MILIVREAVDYQRVFAIQDIAAKLGRNSPQTSNNRNDRASEVRVLAFRIAVIDQQAQSTHR